MVRDKWGEGVIMVVLTLMDPVLVHSRFFPVLITHKVRLNLHQILSYTLGTG